MSDPTISPVKPHLFAPLWQGLRALFFLKPDPRRIGGGVATLCVLFVLDALVSLGVEWMGAGFQGNFNWSALNGVFAQVPFFLLAGWVAARRSRNGIETLTFAILAVAIGPPLTLLGFACTWFGADWPLLMAWLYPLLIAWWTLALVVAYVRLVGRGFFRSGAGLVWIGLASAVFFLPHQDLILLEHENEDDMESPQEPDNENEGAFYVRVESPQGRAVARHEAGRVGGPRR